MAVAENLAFRTFDEPAAERRTPDVLAAGEGDARKCAQTLIERFQRQDRLDRTRPSRRSPAATCSAPCSPAS